MATLRVANPHSLPTVPYRQLDDFQGDLKLPIEPDDLRRLKQSLIDHGVFVPKFVWFNPSGRCCIMDGHQTKTALAALEADGYTIPQIPYVQIEATDERDAKTKLLQLNSQYAAINPDSEWVKDTWAEPADLEALLDSIAIPELDPDTRPTIGFLSDDDAQDGREMMGQGSGNGTQPVLVTLFLNQAEAARWAAYKAQVGIQTDTKAFLTLLNHHG